MTLKLFQETPFLSMWSKYFVLSSIQVCTLLQSLAFINSVETFY